MNERKIPTLVGLCLVAVSVLVFRFAFDRISPRFLRASETTDIRFVTVSNISDSGFTVTWMTSQPASGSVRIERVVPASVYYDERMRDSLYSTHSVNVRNLKPETTYAFRILSNGVSSSTREKPYEVTTAPKITGVGTTLEPSYGQLTAPSGNPVENAIVYLTLEGGQTLSTLTNASGTWVIPLNLARVNDLSRYMPSQDRIDESILIRTPDGEALARTDTVNDNPVPLMTVGKTYDFRKIQADGVTAKNLTKTPPTVMGANTYAVSITKPIQGAAIPSHLPLIQGTGIPGNQVLLIIGIDTPISDTVMVDSDGIWRYTPLKSLQEGKQSITVTSQDAQNKTVALTHTFEILKSGTQVLGDATPSATLAPLPTPEEEPTPTPPLAGDPVPETGSSIPLVILLILGVGLIGNGLVMYARRYS